MLQDCHTAKISKPIAVPVGAGITIISGKADAWIYIHEISGDLSSAGSVEFLDGVTSLARFTLDAGQGLTLQDEPGADNVSRFRVKPGHDFKMTVVGGQFDGSVDYSYRY